MTSLPSNLPTSLPTYLTYLPPYLPTYLPTPPGGRNAGSTSLGSKRGPRSKEVCVGLGSGYSQGEQKWGGNCPGTNSGFINPHHPSEVSYETPFNLSNVPAEV